MMYKAMTTPHPYRVNEFPTPHGEVESIHCVDGWPVGSVDVIGVQPAVMRHVSWYICGLSATVGSAIVIRAVESQRGWIPSLGSAMDNG
jgi:hypothetical protein